MLSLGIPVCGRPDRLNNLLASLDHSLFSSIVVVNTTPDHQAEIHELYDQLFKTYNCLEIRSPWSGPSAARQHAVVKSLDLGADHILLLDEDLVACEHTVNRMLELMQSNPDIDICSGRWIDFRNDSQNDRPLGFIYLESIRQGMKCIEKHRYPSQGRKHPLQLHDVQASMLAKASIFQQVSFDPKYEFFMELFDFFYQCYKSDIKIFVNPSSVFKHYPGSYQTGSQKRNADKKKKEAQKYFESKWGVQPIIGN
jgi:GT2 family glycosyltransferase